MTKDSFWPIADCNEGQQTAISNITVFALRPLNAPNLLGIEPIFSLLKRFIKFIKMAQLQERLPP
ncbi:hypothetical protein [Pseudomonas sp. Xaverov 259]|uniref:hypothetical protein n=1 Tax=Pseudomonas sp. Xaverov 259 TaxID=2666086 RepID=UPI001C5BD467|nr:hypothetical protein [Pseudomonas sp. Xaverov 259]